MIIESPFPSVLKIQEACHESWKGFETAVASTASAEAKLRHALQTVDTAETNRLLASDTSLVLFGSFARHEWLPGSDYDWGLLIDGVVDTSHSELARKIGTAMRELELKQPGSSGTFGNLIFSHELVHRIGGGADSNANLTRRMLMLLESRPIGLAPQTSDGVWKNVLRNILKRYFEEDVHFTPGTVPRFLLNDMTRYWQTICVDYAAKYREQDGEKWAIRNAKLRLSRKLLYAAGLAFCFDCQLTRPRVRQPSLFEEFESSSFIDEAVAFARTPALEYLAAFVLKHVTEPARMLDIGRDVFGAYNEWLVMLSSEATRTHLEGMNHRDAYSDSQFESVKGISYRFSTGLEKLFFNRDAITETDGIARLSLEYMGF